MDFKITNIENCEVYCKNRLLFKIDSKNFPLTIDDVTNFIKQNKVLTNRYIPDFKVEKEA